MNLVPTRKLVSRSLFRKIPFGAIYYLAADDTGPFVKTGTTRRLRANTDPQITPAQVTVTNTAAAVIRVGKFVTQSQRTI